MLSQSSWACALQLQSCALTPTRSSSRPVKASTIAPNRLSHSFQAFRRMSLLQRNAHFTLIGMVHLKPLPGSVGWNSSMQQVIDFALADALALSDGGVDAIMIENYGDVPFRKDDVEAHTVAA